MKACHGYFGRRFIFTFIMFLVCEGGLWGKPHSFFSRSTTIRTDLKNWKVASEAENVELRSPIYDFPAGGCAQKRLEYPLKSSGEIDFSRLHLITVYAVHAKELKCSSLASDEFFVIYDADNNLDNSGGVFPHLNFVKKMLEGPSLQRDVIANVDQTKLINCFRTVSRSGLKVEAVRSSWDANGDRLHFQVTALCPSLFPDKIIEAIGSEDAEKIAWRVYGMPRDVHP